MAHPGSFFSFTTSRPVAITMVVLAVVVFGVVGLLRLPVNLLPDISYPSITIRTLYPGAGPRDVEERVSEKIQENVAVIPGVRRVVSVSRPEVSDVILEFAWGTEMVFAVSDVRERLDRFFPPEGAERPLVLRYDPSLDPVLTVGLTGDMSLVELRRIAEEEIEDRLAQVSGVAAVKVRGGDEEEIRISVDEQALTALNLDVGVIGRRLAAENLNAASGSIEEGRTEFLVRALNEYRNLQEIEDTILVRRGDVSIRLREVARVTRVPADKEVISRIDDRACVLIDIQKEAGANIVELCRLVRDRIFGTEWQRASVAAGLHLKPFEPDMDDDPQDRMLAAAEDARLKREMQDFLVHEMALWGVEFHQLQDQSKFIQASVDDVLSSALKGGLFAILVIFLFLRRFASTAILAVSIPISLIATFSPMFLSDIDLNIMSLGGLALGVGMLVDNSIVVLESIARMREEGHELREAAVLGVSRVASAVTASTLTTVAVFFPIVFVEGVAGQLFHDQALTVVYALLMSLLVALFVIPMLATRGIATDKVQPTLQIGAGWVTSGRPEISGASVLSLPFRYGAWILQVAARSLGYVATRGLTVLLRGVFVTGAALGWCVRTPLRPVLAGFNAVYEGIDRTYPRILGGALRHRAAVVAVALALFGAAVSRIGHLGNELLPEVHQGEFWVESFLPRDATVERTDAVMREIDERIRENPEVESTFLASGVDKEELNDSDQGEHSARILVKLSPGDHRLAQELEVQSKIRDVLQAEPQIQSYRITQPSILSFTAPLVVEVVGHNLHNLRVVSTEVAALLQSVPGLSDVRSTMQRGNPEVTIRLDRDKIAALELDAASVTGILKTKVQGEIPTRFSELERKIDMRVRMDQEEIGSVARLEDLNVNPAGYPSIPLGSVAEVRRLEGPSEIRHLGNLRGAEVQAALAGFDLGRTQLRVEAALADVQLPRGIELRLGGQKEDLEQSQRSLTMALCLAVFLVYIVMASQFESMVQPLIILTSLPLALVGVVLSLEILGIALSVVVFLGAIVLAGIVVNNAIILIDQINRLRAGGVEKLEAIVRGAHMRLRPVLMTTVTTVLGLLPLTGWLTGLPVLGGSGDGIELRAPMAVTVITGLLSSTILTLVLVPVVYSFSDRRT